MAGCKGSEAGLRQSRSGRKPHCPALAPGSSCSEAFRTTRIPAASAWPSQSAPVLVGDRALELCRAPTSCRHGSREEICRLCVLGDESSDPQL